MDKIIFSLTTKSTKHTKETTPYLEGVSASFAPLRGKRMAVGGGAHRVVCMEGEQMVERSERGCTCVG